MKWVSKSHRSGVGLNSPRRPENGKNRPSKAVWVAEIWTLALELCCVCSTDVGSNPLHGMHLHSQAAALPNYTAKLTPRPGPSPICPNRGRRLRNKPLRLQMPGVFLPISRMGDQFRSVGRLARRRTYESEGLGSFTPSTRGYRNELGRAR